MIALTLFTITALALERPAELPAPLEAIEFHASPVESRTLSNGLEVRVHTNREQPLWEVRLVLATGPYADDKGREGTAAALAALLTRGTTSRTSEEFSRDLKALGSSIEATSDREMTVIAASGITRNLEPTLDLWAETLLEPALPAEEWTILQKKRIAELALARETPADLVRSLHRKLTWGETYIGRAPTPESVETVTVKDVRKFYDRFIGPKNAILVAGGDLTADEIVPLLEARIGGWTPRSTKVAPLEAKALTRKPVLYFVDDPGAAQSIIRVDAGIGDQKHPAHHAQMVANQAFGRAFTGRVNLNLREDKGYTYGARCYNTYGPAVGQWFCHTSVRTDVTAESLAEIRAELVAMLGDKPLTDEEVATHRQSILYKWPQAFETTAATLDARVEMWRNDLPDDWLEAYPAGIGLVTTASANAAFREAIAVDQMYWLVIGDKEHVWKGLQAAGLDLIELDRDGKPL